MLVEISHGTISFGAETILSDINFLIKGTEKIAIVGRNGCGKTTLLNLIAGKIDLNKRDSDQDVFIARRGGLTIGYLRQNAFDDDSVTLEEEVKKAFQKILDTKSRLDELVDSFKNLVLPKKIRKRKGYVCLEKAPTLKRRKIIKLTERGMQFVQERILPMRKAEEKAVLRMTERERGSYLALSQKHITYLREEIELYIQTVNC